jgi:2-amino-4-hydroxy-6-hydroxymethyldihydropteridine diphosphokinase
MPLCLIGLGANLGDPSETLRAALNALASHPEIELEAASSFLATKPIGGPEGQGEFLNACATIRTQLSPRETIRALLEIEASLGRTRRTRWEARKLDLDLLLYGELTYREEGVEVPHPRMPSRRFVLDPAEEIAPEMVHPTTGWTVGAMARHLRDAPNLAMLTGQPEIDRSGVVASLKRLESDGLPRLIVLNGADRPAWVREKTVRGAFQAAEDIKSHAVLLPVVLDLWPGEALLCTDASSPEVERTRTFLSTLPTPKLLIDLYLPEQWSADQERWLQILRSDAPAPWIRVDATRPEQAATEILAALQAMQG